MKKFLAMFAAVFILFLPSCSPSSSSVSFFSMDTVMEITAYGKGSDEAAEKARDEIIRLDSVLSSEKGLLAMVNTEKSCSDPEITSLVRYACSVSESCGGALDITVYPVVKAWGFISGDYRIPGKIEITGLLKYVSWESIEFSENGFILPADTEITLGAVAKGYSADRAAEVIKSCGITSALISLGGNVRLIGSRPDGSDWNVAVADPSGEGYAASLRLSDVSVVTSGAYERCFIENGKTYHHIIDPATGYPSDSGLSSVTIVSSDGTLADCLSTALFVMGPEAAEKYYRSHDNFEMLLITDDGRISVSEGLSGVFEVLNDRYTEINVINH